jgi:SAM-dependent methyltransferase
LLRAPDRFHGRTELYQLTRCSACSLVWLENPPPPNEMWKHYGADYDKAISGGGEDPDHWTGKRDVVLRYKSGGAILDLVCSSVGFRSSIKSTEWKLSGIEMSEEVAQKARAKCGADVFVGDILNAPFEPESFDVITCFHVFEHLYQPQEVFARISKWLKPGGIFYAIMPNIDSAGARIFRSYWYALELPRHLFHFSPKSFSSVGGAVCLEAESITTDREVFIELSSRYIIDGILAKAGIHRAPMSKAKRLGVPFRVVRKAFRMTILPLLNGMASFAGDGESIHAVFRKRSKNTAQASADLGVRS